MSIKELELERLIIRKTQKDDTSFCIDMWGDEEIGKYLSDPPKDKADGLYESWAKDIEKYSGCHYFVAISKENSEYIGTCSSVPSENKKGWDLGYCIHKKYWRQGYATEMLSLLIKFCVDNGAEYITADVAKLNEGSNALLRKFGFVIEKEGIFRKGGTDIIYENYTYRLSIYKK